MAAGRHSQSHRLLLLPRILRQCLQIEIGQQRQVVVDRRIADLLQLGIHRKRILIQAHHVAEALAHLLNTIQPHQDRQQQTELGALVEVTLQVAAHGHVELLIGSPQLHIGVHRHGVVSLQQGVEEFMQGNRGATAIALGEVILGQHLAHGGRPQQADDLGQIQTCEPFAVSAHLQATRGLKIEQCRLLRLALAQLCQVGGGIGLNLFSAELHPCGAFAGGIADAGCEVADDQHRRVPRILESPQLAEEDAVAEMDVAAGGINSQLDAQGSGLGFRLLQASRQRLISVISLPGGEQIGHATRQPDRQ
ncbi:MAG: Uncharacterised protein [Cyanobium sp. ARS6]|nr:MAG: Uncharacterised protein [Cyanobium sp. ARS6]